MKATRKNILKINDVAGTAIEVIWPSCHEPVLGHSVEFRIGKKITNLYIERLFPKTRAQKVRWGYISRNGEYPLCAGHTLSRETMNKLKAWLDTAEIPNNAVPPPVEQSRPRENQQKYHLFIYADADGESGFPGRTRAAAFELLENALVDAEGFLKKVKRLRVGETARQNEFGEDARILYTTLWA